MSILENTKRFLGFRKQAYQQTFNMENRFNCEVLADLAKFCRADKSCFHPDQRVHAVLEGRREVFLRIYQHLNLSDDELLKIYATKENK
jgi:hypothetical protein